MKIYFENVTKFGSISGCWLNMLQEKVLFWYEPLHFVLCPLGISVHNHMPYHMAKYHQIGRNRFQSDAKKCL